MRTSTREDLSNSVMKTPQKKKPLGEFKGILIQDEFEAERISQESFDKRNMKRLNRNREMQFAREVSLSFPSPLLLHAKLLSLLE